MQEALYNMIFKRKSFHLFQKAGSTKLTAQELTDIKSFWNSLTPLCPEIRTAMQIVPAEETTNRHGQEYCIALYSEEKDNYLQNIGYLGELLDLYLVSKDIGTCWYGIGKAKEDVFEGLPYVIMIAIAKADSPDVFREDMCKAERKSIEEIWQGDTIDGVTDIARFSPSACNSQPWRVEKDGSVLRVYRKKQTGRVGIMSARRAEYFNRIDMGIYLAILKLCLTHKGIPYSITLHTDDSSQERNLTATVTME